MRRITLAALFTLVILILPRTLAAQDAARDDGPPAEAAAERSAPEPGVMLTTQDWLELERAAPAPRIPSSQPMENSRHAVAGGDTVLWVLVIGVPLAFVIYMLTKPGP